LSAIKRQGTTSEAAEKLPRSLKKRQGTTSVVPQMQQNKCRALAPEGCFHPDLPESASFSATSSVVPKEKQKVTWALAPAILFSAMYNSTEDDVVP
jgi:hypothetical protein